MRSGTPQPACEHCGSRLKGVFGCLDGDAAGRLSDHKSSHVYERGQVLFYEGNAASGVYCVRSGVVKLYKAGARGRRHLLYLARPGDVLGLECFLTAGPHCYTAELVEPGIVCHVERAQLQQLAEERPQLVREIATSVAQQLETSHGDRTDLASAPVRERLAMALLSLGNRFGGDETDSREVRIEVRLSREELAEIIGASTETVIRQLAELKDQDVVRVDGKALVLRDVDRLARIARLAAA
ncbi:MAG: Crp/Fnr family transcriptional regulator [Gemmatimonadetes bacterium]|nr:Crp/Fnr family transcriptional regulator [Gemmatimonadota bacterium]